MALRTEGELRALVTLLGDEDYRMAQLVIQALLDAGVVAVPFLEAAREDPDSRVRGRARALLEEFRLRDLQRRFARFGGQPEGSQDLLEGALLVSEYADPQQDAAAVRAKIDEMAAATRERIAGLTPLEALRAFNRYFFVAKGFRAGDKADPENHFINRLLDRRTGIPISLSVVYVLVGTRAGLPVSGVSFPQQYICRWDGAAPPLFIDPYGGGQILDEGDCIRYLATQGGGYHPDLLRPAPVGRTVARMLDNLIALFGQRDERRRAEVLRRFRTAVLPREEAGRDE